MKRADIMKQKKNVEFYYIQGTSTRNNMRQGYWQK